MTASPDSQVYRRTFAITVMLVGSVAVGLGRMMRLQSDDSLAGPITETTAVTLPAVRGNIFDRNGYLLAVAGAVYDVGVSPHHVGDASALADRLAPLLGMPRRELLAALTADQPYVQLQRGVSAEVWAEIESWEEGGLQADSRPNRIYPHGTLAAHVLGFVTDDGEAAYGVESYYDSLLAGEDGERRAIRDAIGSPSYAFRPPRDGADLYLTLDRNVQHVAEDSLRRAVAANGAARGVAIVMVPQTGAILGMAVMPSFDPNTREVEGQSVFTNPAVSEPYEPGSVFKALTMAAALDSGAIVPESTYFDRGAIRVGGETIENSDHLAYGETSLRDLLAHSLNVGAAYLSTELGAFQFYEYIRRFGVGELTGVDLAYEVPGWVRLPGDREWHESDLATNSFGQGLALTPLQMLCAVSAVANGGLLMRPYVVGRIDDGETVAQTVPHKVRRAVSSLAASQVTDMLVYAVDVALNSAAIPRYRVAGKSGTSQVPVPGGYDPEQTIASFAGYVPAGDPQLAILVSLFQPQVEHWGGRAAAPVFGEIAQQLVERYGIAPDGAGAQLSGQ